MALNRTNRAGDLNVARSTFGSPIYFDIKASKTVTPSDTVDLGITGYIYVDRQCTVAGILADDSASTTWEFEMAGIYPMIFKRILETGTDVGVTIRIVN